MHKKFGYFFLALWTYELTKSKSLFDQVFALIFCWAGNINVSFFFRG